jgi:hypothetical protein
MTNTFLSLTGVILSFTFPLVRQLNAADIFTKITTGPGSAIGNSRGAAWGDYNNDGFIDLFVPQVGLDGSSAANNLLYRNNTNATFTKVSAGPIATLVSAGFGAVWGDYDNDGKLDLVLVNEQQDNYLFRNIGAGSFVTVPDAVFVPDKVSSRGVSWVDYDSDGYLDLFRPVLNFQPRRLERNNRDGTFVSITDGDFLNLTGSFLGVAWGDYNNDGRPDLFLPNNGEEDSLPNYLFRNDKDGVFTRVGEGVLDGNFNGTAAAWGDYDNDGDLDLFVSCHFHPPEIASRPNLLFRNDGNDTFTSVSSLPANDPEYNGGISTACTWGDYDNDGWLDLFVANRLNQNDYLYHNNGDGTFTKVLDSVVVKDGANSFAAAWGDYDNDGFLDLFVGTGGTPNLLYHNSGNTNHWLKFRLIGTRSNRSAIGAKVRLHATVNGKTFWQMREVSGGDGIRGQNSLDVHFGLGNATNADLVRIEWPSGTVQELTNVAAQQFRTVTEPGGEPRLQIMRGNDNIQLALSGKQGSRYSIEASTALPIWTNANVSVMNADPSGTVSFPAPAADPNPRFYRAVLE